MRTLHMLHSLDVEVGDVGVTVRRGRKWADAKPGEELELCVCTKNPESHAIAGHGVVLEAVEVKFSDVPARLLEYEHELASRSYSGLLYSMRRAYGEEFSESETVVVLTYERKS